VGTASRVLMYITPNSASAADDITAWMIWAVLSTVPLMAVSSSFSERKKYPPALLLACGLLSYDASLCRARTMSLTLYVTMASDWEAAQSKNREIFLNVSWVGITWDDMWR